MNCPPCDTICVFLLLYRKSAYNCRSSSSPNSDVFPIIFIPLIPPRECRRQIVFSESWQFSQFLTWGELSSQKLGHGAPMNYVFISYLVGGLVAINFIFPYIGNNHPNWLIFFRGVQTTNQLYIYHIHCWNCTVVDPRDLWPWDAGAFGVVYKGFKRDGEAKHWAASWLTTMPCCIIL